MIELRCALLSLVAALLLAPSPAHAQGTPRIVQHQVTCPNCRVEFTKVATIGKPSDPALMSRFTNIDRDSRGRYFAFSDYSQVMVFDSTGNFLRTFGRAGSGPGEFESRLPGAIGGVIIPSIRAVRVGSGDSIFVFHSGRMSVFSPQFTYVRTATVTPALTTSGSTFFLADGSWLMGGDLARGRATGPRAENLVLRRIHMVGPQGEVRRSLGKADTIAPTERTTGVGGFFLVSPDARSIWLDDGHARYIFDQWRVSDNAHLGRIEIRDIPWFAERTSVTEQGRNGPYQRTVGGSYASIAGIDTSGYLWISGRVANPAAPQRSTSPSERYRAMFLEILDPRTVTLRSLQKIDHLYSLFPRGDLAYSAAENSDGVLTFTTYRFRYVAR